MQNLTTFQGEIKTVVEACDGTSTNKLIAVLVAAGFTDNKEIAALAGVTVRAVQKFKANTGSRTHVRNEPTFANDGSQTNPRSPKANPRSQIASRVEDKLLPPQQEEISQPHKSKSKPEKPAGNCKRGSRLPDDWVLPNSWGQWALVNCPTSTAEAIREVAQDFADYWHAKAGKDAVKADWPATWRRWCRNNFKTGPTRKGFGSTYRPQDDNVINIKALRHPSGSRPALPAPGSVMMEVGNA